MKTWIVYWCSEIWSKIRQKGTRCNRATQNMIYIIYSKWKECDQLCVFIVSIAGMTPISEGWLCWTLSLIVFSLEIFADSRWFTTLFTQNEVRKRLTVLNSDKHKTVTRYKGSPSLKPPTPRRIPSPSDSQTQLSMKLFSLASKAIAALVAGAYSDSERPILDEM